MSSPERGLPARSSGCFELRTMAELGHPNMGEFGQAQLIGSTALHIRKLPTETAECCEIRGMEIRSNRPVGRFRQARFQPPHQWC